MQRWDPRRLKLLYRKTILGSCVHYVHVHLIYFDKRGHWRLRLSKQLARVDVPSRGAERAILKVGFKANKAV